MSHGRVITLVGCIAALVLAGFLATTIRLRASFEQSCHLLPQAEWLLLQTAPDTFEARLLDRRVGNRTQTDLFRFQRGDFVSLRLSESMTPGTQIAAGHQVALLDSYESRQAVGQLDLRMQEAVTGLRAAESGAKEALVAQARDGVAAAEAENVRRASMFEHARSMLRQGVISHEEFVRREARHREAQAELEAARNWLRATEVGERDEILAMHRARIDLLRQRLADAEERLEAQRIRCPIAGELATLAADTALVRVASVDTLYAFAPVPPSRAMHLAPGHAVTVRPMGTPGVRAAGHVVRIDRHASHYAGRTFFWVSAAVPNEDGRLAAGNRAELRFHAAKISLFAWIVDRLSHASDRTLGV